MYISRDCIVMTSPESGEELPLHLYTFDDLSSSRSEDTSNFTLLFNFCRLTSCKNHQIKYLT